MFFWWKAAQIVAGNSARRFGFITSNSLRQTFCRRVVADALAGKRKLRLVFAIPDHPWADGVGSAAVRIAMTTAESMPKGKHHPALLQRVVDEKEGADRVPTVTLTPFEGSINADLTIGADATIAEPLRANDRLCCPGMKLHGAGFIVSPATAANLGIGPGTGAGATRPPLLERPRPDTAQPPHAPSAKVREMLDTLVALGQAHRAQDGRYYT
jgi:hypothetical protein